MRSVSISDLKAHLSEHLRYVKEGERIVVTERGKPIAELGPPPAGTEDERIARLVSKGLVKLPKVKPTKEWWEAFWKMPRGQDPTGSVARAVIEDRESGY